MQTNEIVSCVHNNEMMSYENELMWTCLIWTIILYIDNGKGQTYEKDTSNSIMVFPNLTFNSIIIIQ